MEEVDMPSIKRKAYCNMIVRGVTRILGLRAITDEEMVAAGIDLGSVGEVTYGKSSQNAKWGTEATKKAEELWGWLMNIWGDAISASDDLERRTTWVNDGETVPGRRDHNKLSEKQVHFHHKTIKRDFEEYENRSTEN